MNIIIVILEGVAAAVLAALSQSKKEKRGGRK